MIVFFDDILVYKPNWIMHLDHVRKAFEILKASYIFINLKKCALGQQDIEYLGHIQSSLGV